MKIRKTFMMEDNKVVRTEKNFFNQRGWCK